jgi:hypothetical protein
MSDRQMRVVNMVAAVLRQELNRNCNGVTWPDFLFRANGGLEREKIGPALRVREE